jgi:hypothetical protein
MVETGGIAAGLASGVSRCSALQSSLDKVEQRRDSKSRVYWSRQAQRREIINQILVCISTETIGLDLKSLQQVIHISAGRSYMADH